MHDKILIVDDDDLVLDCFKRLLARRFNVETATGPDEALQAIAERGPYAVLVSDLRMPGMNGLQLLEKAKQLSPNIVGILLSGNVEPNDFESNAVYRVLDKPCPPALLAETLTEALSRHIELCGTN